MKITIKIECESITEFHAHLHELQKQIRSRTKKLALNPIRDEFPAGVDLDDYNCYGSHEVQISNR